MADIKPLEPCHSDPCDGVEEIVKLLPQGDLWDVSKDTNLGAHFRALGDIKSYLNEIICQEWNEIDPCKSRRLFSYWADRLGYPACLPQCSEFLCDWIDLTNDPDCPVGSFGFLRRLIELVAPDVTVTFTNHFQDGKCEEQNCICGAGIVLEASPNLFYYDTIDIDYPMDALDGKNVCRSYFIPEINCIRGMFFPIGKRVAYATNPRGVNGEQISGVPEGNTGINLFPDHIGC